MLTLVAFPFHDKHLRSISNFLYGQGVDLSPVEMSQFSIFFKHGHNRQRHIPMRYLLFWRHLPLFNNKQIFENRLLCPNLQLLFT